LGGRANARHVLETEIILLAQTRTEGARYIRWRLHIPDREMKKHERKKKRKKEHTYDQSEVRTQELGRIRTTKIHVTNSRSTKRTREIEANLLTTQIGRHIDRRNSESRQELDNGIGNKSVCTIEARKNIEAGGLRRTTTVVCGTFIDIW
jgi:hypothetical protein